MIPSQQAIAYKRNYADIEAHIHAQKFQQAENLCLNALKYYPNDFLLNYYSALSAFKQKNNSFIAHAFKALDALNNETQISLSYAEAINMLGIIFKDQKYFNPAIKCFHLAFNSNIQSYEYAYNLANTYALINNLDFALSWFLKAKNILKTADVLNSIGNVLNKKRRVPEALEYYKQALEISPQHIPYVYNVGIALKTVGLITEAEIHFRKAAQNYPENLHILCELSHLIKFHAHDKEHVIFINKIQKFLSNTGIETKEKADLTFALGKVYQDIKDTDRAFHSFVLANKLKSVQQVSSIELYNNYYSRHINTYTQTLFRKKRLYGNKTAIPIFIVGMPRSGTTLTEQIITSHSKVYGVGETQYIKNIIDKIEPRNIPACLAPFTGYPEIVTHLSKTEIQAFALEYLKYVEFSSQDNLKITEKMPENFFNIGFIKLIFPNSTIINCKRHPLDILLSIFFQNFVDVPYSSDINNIINHYKCYDQFMKHWHKIFPGKIYDSYYEELIYRQEEKSHQLIKFCGLKWEDSCLNFHDNKAPVFTASSTQVRKPIYKKSIFGWKKYEKHLRIAKESLSSEIKEYETELIQRIPELEELL